MKVDFDVDTDVFTVHYTAPADAGAILKRIGATGRHEGKPYEPALVL
jgi:hypothetical protein